MFNVCCLLYYLVTETMYVLLFTETDMPVTSIKIFWSELRITSKDYVCRTTQMLFLSCLSNLVLLLLESLLLINLEEQVDVLVEGCITWDESLCYVGSRFQHNTYLFGEVEY